MSDCTIWIENVPDGQCNFISHTIAFVIASVMSAKRCHSHTRRGHSRQWPTRLFCSHGATLACTRLSIKLAAVEAIPWHKYFLTRDEDSLHHERLTRLLLLLLLSWQGMVMIGTFLLSSMSMRTKNDLTSSSSERYTRMWRQIFSFVIDNDDARDYGTIILKRESIFDPYRPPANNRRQKKRNGDEGVGTSIESFRITSLIVHARRRRRKRTTIRSITLNNDDVRIEQLPSLGCQWTNNGPVYGF